jgi:hypothetical protein
MDQFTSDSAYFLRRADEERAAAERATDPRARQSHIDLAQRYAEAARAVAAATQREAVDAVPASPAPAALLQPEFRILP